MYKNWSFACFRLWPFDCINYNNVCSYIPSPLKGILSYWPPCSRYYPIHIICVRISIKTSFEALDYCKVHTSIVLRILDLIVTIYTHTYWNIRSRSFENFTVDLNVLRSNPVGEEDLKTHIYLPPNVSLLKFGTWEW